MSGRSLVARLALLLALVAAQAFAGDDRDRARPQPTTAAVEGPTRTGKERLGGKWSDEQRLDNCNVPPDKRGARKRPDGCAPPRSH